MKKTFKKQFIFPAVVIMMLMLALVLPASAESGCPNASDPSAPHSSKYITELRYEPTCTQAGYVIDYCSYCNEPAVGLPYENVFAQPTGHSFEVSYEADTVNGGFKRVRVCQNPLCQREETFNGTDFDKIEGYTVEENGYYSVSYCNTYEAPSVDAENHKDYYLAEFYNKNDRKTWLSNGTYTQKLYAHSQEETVDGAVDAPAYELINEANSIKLYVKQGQQIPEYEGEIPARIKDKTAGKYIFTGWESADYGEDGVTKNTILTATFEAEETFHNFTFRDGDLSALTAVRTVGFGDKVKYVDLKEPTKASDHQKHYEFDGWTIGRNGATIYGIQSAAEDGIPVYYTEDIYAHFKEELNDYTVEYVDYQGNAFENEGVPVKSEGVNYGSDLSEEIKNLDLEVARDKVYIYEYAKSWAIKEVNGYKVNGDVVINERRFDLPSSLIIEKDGSLEKIIPSDGDVITITPRYQKVYVDYTFKVQIMVNYFQPEDLYENNNILVSDLLDKFVIQVKDANGQFIAGGQTDSNGVFYFNAKYSDTITITAVTQNNKYYGEKVLYLNNSSLEQLESFKTVGVTIAPKVTQEWLDGLKGCSCICHSILSPIVVRIYNILYKIFGIKYVCCDDLFIVHGSILAYTK